MDGGKGDGEEGADGSEDMKDMGSKGDGDVDGGESMSGEGTESSDSDLPDLSDRQREWTVTQQRNRRNLWMVILLRRNLLRKIRLLWILLNLLE